MEIIAYYIAAAFFYAVLILCVLRLFKNTDEAGE